MVTLRVGHAYARRSPCLGAHIADAAPAARGAYKPRRPQASPLFRLVSDHLQRPQTVYDERFAHEHGPRRPVVEEAVQFLERPLFGDGGHRHSRPVLGREV